MRHLLLITAALLALGACATTDQNVVEPAPLNALQFVQLRLIGIYTGEWTLFGLDDKNKPYPMMKMTDQVTATNPRIENDRAIVDVTATMHMGEGAPPFTLQFIEGVTVAEGGEMGDYFVEQQGGIQIYEEVKPNVWESESPLSPRDYQAMANITAESVQTAWKRTTKVVSWVDGTERHDITTLTHVEYTDAQGNMTTVEYTSISGFHLKSK